MTNEELKQLVESNARAIQALSDERERNERENQINRNRLYQAMSTLASSQAAMANTHAEFQANFYARQQELDERQQELSRRQGEIVEVLRVITKKLDRSEDT